MKWSALWLAVLLSAGCAGTLHDAIEVDGIRVERGMSIREAKAVLGRPAIVFHGCDQIRFIGEFWKIRIGMGEASEWVWLRPDPAVVIWTHGGKVDSIGTLPRDVALRVRLGEVVPPPDPVDSEGSDLAHFVVALVNALALDHQ